MATTAPNANPTPSLSFPRPIFAALSPRPFLHANLTSTANKSNSRPHRANGRQPTECRTPGINTGSLTHCNGSAVVRLENTIAVCGVRAEILKAEDVPGTNEYPSQSTQNAPREGNELEGMDAEKAEEDQDDNRQELSDLRLVVPNIELSTGSTPSLLPGNAPSGFTQTLLTRLHSLLHSTNLVRARDLRISYTPPPSPDEQEEGGGQQQTVVKGYWVLYIDTLFISLDGNAFDAAWLAMLSALRDTKLPRAWFDEEAEMILCSDRVSESTSLRLRGLPLPCTFAALEAPTDGENEARGEEVGNWVLSDPDAFEESICRENVCVVVDRREGLLELRKVEKSGGGVVDRETLKGLIKRAGERWVELEGVLNGVK